MGLFSKKREQYKYSERQAKKAHRHRQAHQNRQQHQQACQRTAPQTQKPHVKNQEAQKAQKPKDNPSYTIDCALNLLKNLPNQEELTIQTVIRTLGSAQINVSCIMEEARNKINRLNDDNVKLNSEIAALESEIEKRKNQLLENEKSLLETSNLQNQFSKAIINKSQENKVPNRIDDLFTPPPIPRQKIPDNFLTHGKNQKEKKVEPQNDLGLYEVSVSL